MESYKTPEAERADRTANRVQRVVIIFAVVVEAIIMGIAFFSQSKPAII